MNAFRRLIFIHGPAASGKFTIGQELSKITGIALFHNHLTVDLLLTLFPFGSPQFVRQRERIWVELMTDVVADGRSLIFTFHPERTVSPTFPGDPGDRIRATGGWISFVEVVCSDEEIERRIEAKSRSHFRKLNSLSDYRKLKAQRAFDYPPIHSDCQVDSSRLAPGDAALRIREELALPRKRTAPDCSNHGS